MASLTHTVCIETKALKQTHAQSYEIKLTSYRSKNHIVFTLLYKVLRWNCLASGFISVCMHTESPNSRFRHTRPRDWWAGFRWATLRGETAVFCCLVLKSVGEKLPLLPPYISQEDKVEWSAHIMAFLSSSHILLCFHWFLTIGLCYQSIIFNKLGLINFYIIPCSALGLRSSVNII